MSNDTRTLLVVLLVCGFLMCGCIVLPLGVGAAFFFTASRQAQVAQAEAQRAVAAEQLARVRADLAQARGQALEPIAIPGMPALPSVPSLPAIPAPPDPSSLLQSGLVPAKMEDPEWRKQIYTSFKLLRTADEELKKAGADDPTVALIASAVNQQKETLLKGAGLTPEQLNQILAEGDKAGW